MRISAGVLAVCLSAACGASPPLPSGPPPSPNTDQSYRSGRNAIEYTSIPGGAQPLEGPVTLCHVVQGFTGPAGLFRVDRIIGVTESPVGGGPGAGVTYVELSVVEDWGGGAPPTAIARISGGPVGNGVTLQWSIALDQGETDPIILTEPIETNRNYYGISNLGLFRPTPLGGISNGQLFTKTVETIQQLGVLVRAIRARTDGTCAADAVPDGA